MFPFNLEDLIASEIRISIIVSCFKSSFKPVIKPFTTPNSSAKEMEIV
jgi:hypothetical protein